MLTRIRERAVSQCERVLSSSNASTRASSLVRVVGGLVVGVGASACSVASMCSGILPIECEGVLFRGVPLAPIESSLPGYRFNP